MCEYVLILTQGDAQSARPELLLETKRTHTTG